MPRGVLMPVLGLEVGHHTKLPIRFRFSLDAGLLAHPRMLAVGADHAFRADRLAVGQRELYGVGFHFETGGGMRERLHRVGKAQRGFQRALDQRRFGNPR